MNRMSDGMFCGKALRVALVAFLFMVSAAAFAQENNTIIPERDVNVEDIVRILTRADLNATVDKDGDVKVVFTGETVWLSVSTSLNRIYIFTFQNFNEGTDVRAMLNLCNRINDELVMIRATAAPENRRRLWLDYSIPLEGGVTPAQIVNTVKRFCAILQLIPKRDVDGIVDFS